MEEGASKAESHRRNRSPTPNGAASDATSAVLCGEDVYDATSDANPRTRVRHCRWDTEASSHGGVRSHCPQRIHPACRTVSLPTILGQGGPIHSVGAHSLHF